MDLTIYRRILSTREKIKLRRSLSQQMGSTKSPSESVFLKIWLRVCFRAPRSPVCRGFGLYAAWYAQHSRNYVYSRGGDGSDI